MVQNPTVCRLTQNDPDATGWEIDFVRKSDSGLAQTLIFQLAQTTVVDGKRQMNVNVMPIAKGVYTTVARELIGAAKSTNSAPSPEWERAAGPPSDVVML